MIAVDTNILVYAHRAESPWHGAAWATVARLAEARPAWAIAWPCLHEFLAVVTNPRVLKPPTPFGNAIDQIEAWRASPSLMLISETENHWAMLKDLTTAARTAGPAIHDARVAAICLEHGVNELFSADRDFARYPALKVRNPLV